VSDYWEKRALERLLRIELIGDDYAGRIYRLYKNAFNELNGELSSLFDRYAEQGGLTPIEAAQYLREPVTRAQSDALMKLIDSVEDPDAKRKLLARANSSQYAARMKRIQAMQESIRAECAKVAEQEISAHQEAARRIGTESYYRTVFDFQQGAGAAIPFAGITIDEIDAVLARKWTGESYSARVWDNTSAMAQKLGEIVRTNVATGRPWERCVGELQEYMATPGQGGAYAAERLLRTETMHVYNEISAGASSSMGAKRYRFIAVLDLKTSELCRAHDGLKDPDTGKFYTYANRKPGVNFPPLHPWCRSTEAPYINADTLKGLTRPAKDPVTGKIVQVPATMTYEKWHKKYVEGKPEAELAEKMIKNTAGDRSQWEQYRGVLGKEAPKDLAAFQRMKYTDPAEWNGLKRSYRDTISVNRILPEPLKIDSAQFGKKIGKHAEDFGLEAANADHREKLYGAINDIVDNFDTVAKGSWRGQQAETLFFIKGEDAVVTSQHKAFITVLKGGAENARIKNARRIRILSVL